MIGTGLQAPTVAEARRMDLVAQAGCICCWAFAELGVPCEVHHLTIGGHHGAPRRGHAFTVGICGWHHRGAWNYATWEAIGRPAGKVYAAAAVGPSYALQPNSFRRVFGNDDALLMLQSERLAQMAASFVIHPGRYADPALPEGFAP